MIRIYPSSLESSEDAFQPTFHRLVVQFDHDPLNSSMFQSISHSLKNQKLRPFHIYLHKSCDSPYRPVIGRCLNPYRIFPDVSIIQWSTVGRMIRPVMEHW